MPIMKVSINGTDHIVESPDFRTAKAWAKTQVTIEVAVAGAADLRNLTPEQDIPVLGIVDGVDESAGTPETPVFDSKPNGIGKMFGLGGR